MAQFGKVRVMEGEDLQESIRHYKVLSEMNARLEIELENKKLLYDYRIWERNLKALQVELGEIKEDGSMVKPPMVKDEDHNDKDIPSINPSLAE